MSSQYLKVCSDIACNPIPELLTSLSAGLKHCSVSSPTEVLPDTQVIALCAILPLSGFEELTFAHLQLSINSWVAIADACSKTRTLQRLTFKECNVREGQGMSAFARSLGSAELQQLDMLHCRLGDEFVSGLAEGTLLTSDKLHSLRLAGCSLTCDGACRLASALESVGMMSSLRLLDLSGNRIGDRGACGLAAMLISEGASSSVPLNTLELEGNQITDVGGLALCRAAKGALVMSRLNISLNAMSDATLNALAEALRFNTGTLKEVAAAGCRAGEAAAIAVVRAATKNNTLQLLDIRGVPLGPEGVAQLCQMLRYTASLNTLRFDVATREGAEAIARELPSNRSLMHITMGGPVPDGLLAHMSEILASNTVRQLSTSPARGSPHIHAWIEDATTAGRPHGNNHNHRSSHSHAAGGNGSVASRSPSVTASPHILGGGSGPLPPEFVRSPRSEAGNSSYSHGTYKTNRTGRTARTNTTYFSFNYTDISRRTIGGSPLRASASLAAGGAAEKAAIIFRKHDLNNDNFLNKDEMLQALNEVGVLAGIRAKHVGRYLDAEFKKADWDKDGKISLSDFISYYEKIAHYQTQVAREGRIKSMTNVNKQMIPVGTENNPQLKKVFRNYCKFALGQGRQYNDGVPHMNAQQFHRLCQDAGFVEPDGRLTTTAIDVIFYRYRPTGARRLGFKEYLEALAAIAYEAGMQFEEIMIILGCRNNAAPLTPNGGASAAASERLSEGGGPIPSTALPIDPSFDNLVPGLPTVAEGYEHLPARHSEGGLFGGTTAVARAAAMAAAVRSSVASGHVVAVAPVVRKGIKNSKTIKNANAGGAANNLSSAAGNGGPMAVNPLYESQEAAVAAAVATSTFAINRSAPGTRPGSIQVGPGDFAVLEARLRMDMESRLSAMEARFAGQRPSQAGNQYVDQQQKQELAGRVRILETTVSDAIVRQEELDTMSRQVGDLQCLLHRLSEELSSMKIRESSRADGGSNADTAAIGRRVEEVVTAVGQMAGDVAGMNSRLESVQSSMRAVSEEQKHISQRAVDADTVASLEKRLMDRQARFEGALMQVAKQVDLLDTKMKEEAEASVKAMEAILAKSANPGSTAMRSHLLGGASNGSLGGAAH